jgi:hypothetical protein
LLGKIQENKAKKSAPKKEEDQEMFEDFVDGENDLVTIYIVKNPPLLSNGLGQSFCVIAPEGYGMDLWRRLIYSGCKAIGEREHLKLMMECARRVFPWDYPETKAGQ